jgi:hypothetical protein
MVVKIDSELLFKLGKVLSGAHKKEQQEGVASKQARCRNEQ